MNGLVNKVIEGDSLEVLKEFPDGSVNLIITSPPYFGCRVYGDETLGREKHPLEYVRNIFEFTKEFKRVLHENGSFYLNMMDVYFGTKGFGRVKGKYLRKTHENYKHHEIVEEDGKYLQNKQLLMLPQRVAIMMQEDGWILRNQNIWYKPNPCPNFSSDRRLPSYEYFYHFVKSRDYYFDWEAAKRLGHHQDVIRCGIESFKDHQASFPEKLITPFVFTTSREGDIVLDPFGGSGTVGVVCRFARRKYILIELNGKYCEDSRKRIASADGKNIMETYKKLGIKSIDVNSPNVRGNLMDEFGG